ncbi:hypothetical protein [Bacillus sp. AFS023182]|uniref:hypothetical protein n=1 Tax=Bacillus sp. AFS023182 TaxID=2033492 RepID=UPI001596F608|nr:hypothetical protein [Bacillus sp. AFS023182]
MSVPGFVLGAEVELEVVFVVVFVVGVEIEGLLILLLYFIYISFYISRTRHRNT